MSTEKVNILIVEDESIVALDLSEGLKRGGYTIAGMANNAQAAKTLFEKGETDIVLMDIHLKGEKDGIDTVVDLMKIKQTPVIYLTAYMDAATVERVKKTYPAAFLSKPYNIQNVQIAIELALNNLVAGRNPDTKTGGKPESTGIAEKGNKGEGADREAVLQWNDSLFVKTNCRFVKIPLSSLLYVSAENNYIHLVTSERKYVLRLSLNQFMEKVCWNRLVRIHRSHLVNTDAIQSFAEQEVTVGKEILPVGKQYKEAFWQQFGFR
ncbi:MAG TPA: LytTR family transcriptional regulator DNA-binding domain-containing protein [Puia sp.]|nr:LytTR family transcriptional regulator DNA-binding domain-containing protein [Puia sp.]